MVDRGISPDHILAVTFTNKAAREMQQRVAKLRSFIRSGSVVPLRNLLAAGSEKFIVSNALDLEQSNVHYLQSWAVVYYLSMRRGAKGGNLFGPYVSRLARGEDPARAFGVLSGQTLEQVDRAWRELFSR